MLKSDGLDSTVEERTEFMDRITSSEGTPIACHRLGDGLPLIVADAARAELVQQGVEVGEVQDLGGVLYASFSDPDGNGWTLQQWPN
jgi:hypothetical protein